MKKSEFRPRSLAPANYPDLEHFDRRRRRLLGGLGATLLGSALLLGAACEPRPRGTAPMPPSRLDEADAGPSGAGRAAKERFEGNTGQQGRKEKVPAAPAPRGAPIEEN